MEREKDLESEKTLFHFSAPSLILCTICVIYFLIIMNHTFLIWKMGIIITLSYCKN